MMTRMSHKYNSHQPGLRFDSLILGMWVRFIYEVDSPMNCEHGCREGLSFPKPHRND
jgi:hypothetical protein